MLKSEDNCVEKLLPCPMCGCGNVFTYISAFCAVIRCQQCGLSPKTKSAIVIYKKGECPKELIGVPTYEPELLTIRTKDGDIPYPEHGYVGVNAIDALKAYGGFQEWNTRATPAIGADVRGLVAKNDELRDALLDMVWQFCSRNDKLAHSFMSAEEHAFDVLDLDNGMTFEEAEAASKQATLPPKLRGE